MRIKLTLLTFLLFALTLSYAVTSKMILVDKHCGFDSAPLVMEIINAWQELAIRNIEQSGTSCLSNIPIRVYCTSNTSQLVLRTPVDPRRTGILGIAPGEWARFRREWETLKNRADTYIDSCQCSENSNLTNFINGIPYRHVEGCDYREILIVSDYEGLTAPNNTIRIDDFERNGIETELHFYNVENWRTLLNDILSWNPEYPDSLNSIIKKIRCYSRGGL